MPHMIIAAFGSRMQTLRFFEAMKSRCLACSIVNTPREASVGCGISVKFNAADFTAAKALLAALPCNTFSGWFRTGGGKTERI